MPLKIFPILSKINSILCISENKCFIVLALFHLNIQWNLFKLNLLEINFCIQKTVVWFIKVELTKITYTGTLIKVRVIQDSSLSNSGFCLYRFHCIWYPENILTTHVAIYFFLRHFQLIKIDCQTVFTQAFNDWNRKKKGIKCICNFLCQVWKFYYSQLWRL